MSWISAARGARMTRLVGAAALVAAVLSPAASGAPSASAATAPPSIASTSYPKFVAPASMRWRGSHRSATPAFRWKPSATAGVAKYQVQSWHGTRWGSFIRASNTPHAGTMYSGYRSTIDTYAASRTSIAPTIYSGDQACRRVRAVNAAGTPGRWSGWKCAYAPLGTKELERGFDVTPFKYVVRTNGACCNPVISGTYLAKGIRMRVRTGPTYGKARIYIGSTYLGEVNGYARSYGYKYVTRQKSSNLKGRIKVRAISASSRPFQFVSLWALRATAPVGTSKVTPRHWHSHLSTFPDEHTRTGTDAVAPRMTSFTLSPSFPTVRNRNGVYGVKATWKASDNVKVAGYEIAAKWGGDTSYVDSGYYQTTSTAIPVNVDFSGTATCHRIRAYDAAGNHSAWTAWKCAYSPLKPLSGNWTVGAAGEAGGKIWSSVRSRDEFGSPLRSTKRWSAKRLRIQYRVGPSYGRAKVYVGGTYFGTIRANSATNGNRWITLTADREAHERVRFVPITTKDVYIGNVFVMPDVAKVVPSAPERY